MKTVAYLPLNFAYKIISSDQSKFKLNNERFFHVIWGTDTIMEVPAGHHPKCHQSQEEVKTFGSVFFQAG